MTDRIKPSKITLGAFFWGMMFKPARPAHKYRSLKTSRFSWRSPTSLKNRTWIVLGDKFEDKEQELFGKDGFEKIVVQVAGLEKQLGLFDLSQFTPKA